jgi:hypothetical protein
MGGTCRDRKVLGEVALESFMDQELIETSQAGMKKSR